MCTLKRTQGSQGKGERKGCGYDSALNYLPDAGRQGASHINVGFFSYCKIASIFQHLSAANVNKHKIWATL